VEGRDRPLRHRSTLRVIGGRYGALLLNLPALLLLLLDLLGALALFLLLLLDLLGALTLFLLLLLHLLGAFLLLAQLFLALLLLLLLFFALVLLLFAQAFDISWARDAQFICQSEFCTVTGKRGDTQNSRDTKAQPTLSQLTFSPLHFFIR
jgi:hypothetical protein